MTRLVATTSAVLALLFSGVVHGLWTDRWTAAEDQDSILARLQAVPLAVGPWQGEELKTRKTGGSEGLVSITRRYVQRSTGQGVTILLACGRPGPVSIHTPDVCYAASGYEVETAAQFEFPEKGGQQAAQFLTARLRKKKTTEETWLRIFWSWGAGGTWQVTDNPRVTFAGQPQLYKLYVLRDMARPSEPLATDACVAFLSQFVPVLHSELFERP